MIHFVLGVLIGGLVGFAVGHLSESNIIVLADAPHRDDSREELIEAVRREMNETIRKERRRSPVGRSL